MKYEIFPHQTADLALADILGPLSHALDLTEGQPKGHCIRCCYIGTRIGDAIGLAGPEMDDLYYTLLLKDLGCSSNAARICQIYLADDIRFKRDFKTIDSSLSSALRFVFAKTGLKENLSDRIRAIVHILQNGGEIVDDLIETRCQRGAEIAGRLGFGPSVRDGIHSLDEHWNGTGRPQGLRGEAIPLAARIALLAQVADIFHSGFGSDAAVTEIARRSGGWFDPGLADVFARLASDPDFWADLTDPELERAVLTRGAALKRRALDEDFLDDVAAAFSDVIDAKSSFTADHSNRVTLYADLIAEELGYLPDRRRWLRRASLLHDLGKLGVSNQILDKPGKLDDDEWRTIRGHPGAGSDILLRIDAFNDIAPIARHHHERLDGGGYPDRLRAEQLPLDVRIVTVADVFDALSAERPYRDAMPIEKVFGILAKDTGTAFDAECVAALRSAMGRLQSDGRTAGA